MFYLMIGSAAFNNVRQIQRYLLSEAKYLSQILFVFFIPALFQLFYELFVDYRVIKTMVFSVESLRESNFLQPSPWW